MLDNKNREKYFHLNLNILDYEIKENGKHFLNGQIQLLNIGRLLLKRSKLIILDEITSSIDINTEKLLFNDIWNLFNDKTVIIIAVSA